MRTRRTFLALAATAAVAGCQRESAERSTGEDGTETPTAGIGGTETSTGDDGTEPPSDIDEQVAWTQSVPGAVSGAPVVEGDRVVAGTESGTLTALATTDGRPAWRFGVEAGVDGTPVVTDGTVLAVAGGGWDTGATLHARDVATGDERWRVSPTDWRLEIVGTDDDTVYAATADDAIGPAGETLYAFAKADGTERWTAEVGDPKGGVVTGDRVYVPSTGGIDAFEKDGTPAWTYETDAYRFRTLSTVGDTVAIGTATDPRDPTIHGIDAATGEQIWTVEGVRALTTAVVGDRLLVGGAAIASIDPETGEPQWEADVESTLYDPPHADGRLYVVGDEAAAISLDDGTVEWRRSVEIVNDAGSQTAHIAQPAGLLDGQLLVRRSLSREDRNRHLLALEAAGGDRAWSYTAGSALTPLAIEASMAYAGTGESVLAFEP